MDILQFIQELTESIPEVDAVEVTSAHQKECFKIHVRAGDFHMVRIVEDVAPAEWAAREFVHRFQLEREKGE